MHVAVCDDNIADRKHMERLLGRESDRRAQITEGLYIDSYGNEKAILANPMQYDIFYIDLCKTEGTSGARIAQKLCEAGVRVPIYMCCSEIDYRKHDLPKNVFFLDKPLKSDMFITSLDYAYEIKKNAVPLIELREERHTLYVTEADIMYCIAVARHVDVYLADGRIAKIDSSADNLYEQWKHYDTFIMPGEKTIFNGRFIERVGMMHVFMKDGTKFSVFGACRTYAKFLLERYKSEA